MWCCVALLCPHRRPRRRRVHVLRCLARCARPSHGHRHARRGHRHPAPLHRARPRHGEGRIGVDARKLSLQAPPERLDQARALQLIQVVRVREVIQRKRKVLHGHVLPDRRCRAGRDGARWTVCGGGRHLWGRQPRRRGIRHLGCRWVGGGDPGDISGSRPGGLVHRS